MKFKNKLIYAFILSAIALHGLACQQQPQAGNTPTGAYQNLFTAVKAKDSEKIKQSLSKGTLGMADFLATQQKKPMEEIIENGFTATTFAESMPEIRDERIKGNYAAVEVFNQKENRWEDLPYILEDGAWKLAVGDVFQGNHQSPGLSKAQIENQASNKMEIPVQDMSNTNNNGFPQMNGNVNIKTVELPPVNANTNMVQVTPETKPKK